MVAAVERARTAEGRDATVPVPRRVRFDWDKEVMTLWFPNLIGTLLLNAYTIIFPLFERLMIRWVGEAMRSVDEPSLRARVTGFSAQEASHAREHEMATRTLERQGYRTEWLVALLEHLFRDRMDRFMTGFFRPTLGRKLKVGMCAAAEHWTAVLADANLRDLPREFPLGPMAKLYCWHGYEELEHKSVVFDVFQTLTRSYTIRAVTFVFWTVNFVFISVLATVYLLLQVKPRYVFSTWLVRDVVRYTLTREALLWHGVRGFFHYLRPGFHPSRHSTVQAERRALEGLEDARPYSVEELMRATFSNERSFRQMSGMLLFGQPRSVRAMAQELARDAARREDLVKFIAGRPEFVEHMIHPLRAPAPTS